MSPFLIVPGGYIYFNIEEGQILYSLPGGVVYNIAGPNYQVTIGTVWFLQ